MDEDQEALTTVVTQVTLEEVMLVMLKATILAVVEPGAAEAYISRNEEAMSIAAFFNADQLRRAGFIVEGK